MKISRALETSGIVSFRFDFLGSGESDGNFEEMTVLKEVSEAETIEGFSMGGLVASLLAGKVPDVINNWFY